MVMNPHDLLKIKKTTKLSSSPEIPEWVTESLQDVPYVVVRRAPMSEGMIPIGVRGKKRNQRFGAYIAEEDIVHLISPVTILQKYAWREKISNSPMPAIKALGHVHEIFKPYNLLWGPAGSVGFEMVSKCQTVTKSSDLDVVVYADEVLLIEVVENIVNKLNQLSVMVDVQIETPNGSVSLREYAREKGPILMKTIDGAKLVHNPWEPEFVTAPY
ncbi:malonate decarboxylase holo-ACP synthase [Halobacillus sp. Marseille-P3879]|uniref:malonate decarboxylase holo-ACP synthase n=1 Tax=Halobacillus sp. Marseille-P3879 TaxID=2045014 RepID=UPI000C7ABD4B|nr:malonate decarboxylase holo-ACP synthase [Halobacillus sp. Marseille-P3879]